MIDPTWYAVVGAATFGLACGWVFADRRRRAQRIKLEARWKEMERRALEERERARGLLEEHQRLEKSVKELRQVIANVPTIAQRLVESSQLREIPERALDLVQELFAPEYSAFFRASRGAFVAVAAHGNAPYRVGEWVELQEGVVGWAAMKQLPVTIEDVETETALVKAQYLSGGRQYQFDLCVPVVQGRETVAVILVGPIHQDIAHARHLARTIGLMTSVTISSVRTLHEQMMLAKIDGLTRLLNKTHVCRYVEKLVARGAGPAAAMSLFLFDIDHFKHYNDTNGHLAGDELLRSLSALLKDATREGEVVGRYGGEEFLMVMPNAGAEEALRAAERVRSAVAAHSFLFREGQPSGRVTISGGVASFPNDGQEAGTLIRAADDALYQAKRAGRNRVFAYSGAGRVLGGDGTLELTDIALDEAKE